MQIGYWDLTGTDVEDMALCPLCDQPIFIRQEHVVVGVVAHPMGDVANLVHLTCAQIADENDA